MDSSDSLSPAGTATALQREERALSRPASRPKPPSWNDIGDGFETMGKVGLAMAVGFSAASLFCRLAQQGKVRIPPLNALLLGGSSARPGASEPTTRPR